MLAMIALLFAALLPGLAAEGNFSLWDAFPALDHHHPTFRSTSTFAASLGKRGFNASIIANFTTGARALAAVHRRSDYAALFHTPFSEALAYEDFSPTYGYVRLRELDLQCFPGAVCCALG